MESTTVKVEAVLLCSTVSLRIHRVHIKTNNLILFKHFNITKIFLNMYVPGKLTYVTQPLFKEKE
jgi:hypothetical protein